jgi:hypothetical protein
MHTTLVIQLLILVAVANATPIATKKVFGEVLSAPLDSGAAKTVRGIVLSVLATMVVAVLLGLGWKIGAVVAATAMAGDLFSSFVKRRLRRPPSSMAVGLDQIPESLFPLIAAQWFLPVTLIDMAVGTAIFFVCGIALSRILFKLRIRDEPY